MSHNAEYDNFGHLGSNRSTLAGDGRTYQSFGLVTHPRGNASDYPRLFALYCESLGAIDYCDESYTKVNRAYKMLPVSVRKFYSILRYDVHTSETNNKRKGR